MAVAGVKRAVWLLVAAAVLLLMVGTGAIALQIVDYLNHPVEVNSSAGFPVFRIDGELVSYPWFQTGVGSAIINSGMVMLAGAIFSGAATWRARPAVDRPRP